MTLSVRKLLFALLMLLPLSGFCQDLTGTWEGVFTGEQWGRTNQYFIRLELVQIDHDIHGNLSIKNEKGDSIAQVNYILSGALTKKSSHSLRLFRENFYDTFFSQSQAEYFNDLLVEWKSGDTTLSHIEGFWFPNSGPGTLPNGAAGKYAVMRVSNEVATQSMKAWMKAKIMEAKL